MGRYRFVTDYRSGAGQWAAGELVELTDDLAAWLGRDVPGCLEPVVDEPEPEPEPEPRAIEAPPADRMQRKPAQKRGA